MLQEAPSAIAASAMPIGPWRFAKDHFFPIPVNAYRRLTEDLRRPLGVPMILPTALYIVRAWLLCGRSYTVHPIDCVDLDGRIVPLPTTHGLVRSESPQFEWQIDTRRRMLVVAQAENELLRWADANL